MQLAITKCVQLSYNWIPSEEHRSQCSLCFKLCHVFLYRHTCIYKIPSVSNKYTTKPHEVLLQYTFYASHSFRCTCICACIVESVLHVTCRSLSIHDHIVLGQLAHRRSASTSLFTIWPQYMRSLVCLSEHHRSWNASKFRASQILPLFYCMLTASCITASSVSQDPRCFPLGAFKETRSGRSMMELRCGTGRRFSIGRWASWREPAG